MKLGSSGFEMAAQPQPIETLEAPTNVRADATGKNGQLEVRYKSSRGAHSYQLLMATSDPAVNANWKQIAITTKVRYIVSGMESYKAVWFAVVAIGAKNESPLSKPAMGRAA